MKSYNVKKVRTLVQKHPGKVQLYGVFPTIQEEWDGTKIYEVKTFFKGKSYPEVDGKIDGLTLEEFCKREECPLESSSFHARVGGKTFDVTSEHA